MKKTCLLLTSSGGGGHLEATAAIAHELHETQPELRVIQRDILKDWMGRWFGRFLPEAWNYAQKRGNLIVQKLLCLFIPSFHILCWLPVFFNALYLLLRKNVTWIIDSQPFGGHPIFKAIRLVEKWKGVSICYEKVLVDLPTVEAGHYFVPIKKLSQKDKNRLFIHTLEPLLEEGQTEEEFWQLHTGVPLKNISYASMPLRPSFKALDLPLSKHKPITIAPRICSENEWSLLQPILKLGKLETDYCDPYLDLTIPPQAKVTTLMLGSQPAYKATQQYVKHFIDLKRNAPDRHDILFVFCRKKNLLKNVCHQIMTVEEFPDNLTIIPLTFQDDSVIAPLIARSDATITRSGGMTTMELLTTMQGQVYVHSEAKIRNTDAPVEAYLKGIPYWEKGNAQYLIAKKDARITTPDQFPALANNYFIA